MGSVMWTRAAGALAALLALTGCAVDGEAAPAGSDALAVEVVEFDASGFNGPPFAAVVDSATAVRYFGGWFAARSTRLPQMAAHPERFTDLDTHSYVAVVTSTACRLPNRAELRREAAVLRPELLGGTDHQECYRAYTPFVVYKVRKADLEGVNAIGAEPVDRDGPAEVVGRVELASGAAGFAPREITDPAARTALATELGGATQAVLDGTSRIAQHYGTNGVRRYAFPVRACPDDLVALNVTATELRAEVTASPDAPRTCEAPTAHLAVFDIRDTHIPDGARPVA